MMYLKTNGIYKTDSLGIIHIEEYKRRLDTYFGVGIEDTKIFGHWKADGKCADESLQHRRITKYLCQLDEFKEEYPEYFL